MKNILALLELEVFLNPCNGTEHASPLAKSAANVLAKSAHQ